ncbi:MAG TPA: peptide chain release factor 2 [Patescibacteria group bacterium]|nr:peptide chain release factor 2 [Patescibacteria group bacterium]
MLDDELIRRLSQLAERLEGIRVYLDLGNKKKQLTEFDEQMARPGFWDDPQSAQQTLQKRSALKESIERGEALLASHDDAATLVDLGKEGEPVNADLRQAIEDFRAKLEGVEVEMMLRGENDHNNAILSIHPGAGGTEAQDWAEMLYRMYLRWCERRGYSVEVIDYQEGEEAGLKSATALVKGKDAYGYLKAENGVHRLVRISPFDANARRHTSFASVYVYPELNEDIEIEVDEKDLRVDTYRSSGAGGQHVNVTDSAIRITHLPTGIVAQCQNERSQHRNRDTAMKLLKARLYDLERRKKDEKRAVEEGAKKDIEFGSQIRSYVLHPYRMVKDLRTSVQTSQVDDVLDGDLDEFIKTYLLSHRA